MDVKLDDFIRYPKAYEKRYSTNERHNNLSYGWLPVLDAIIVLMIKVNIKPYSLQ